MRSLVALLLFFWITPSALAGDDPTEPTGRRWNFKRDVLNHAAIDAPAAPRYGDWSLLRTSQQVARKWLRDGRYLPLETYGKHLSDNAFTGWTHSGEPLQAPFVGKLENSAGIELELEPDDIIVAPGQRYAVVIAWQSRFAGTLEIRGLFEHAQSGCDHHGQIDWYIERGVEPERTLGFRSTRLASGSSRFGTPSQRSEFHLENVEVYPGDHIYFIVDAKPDGSATPHQCDATRFDVTLTMADARSIGPPEFEQDVRPILAEHCHACHGADTQESRLDVQTLESMLRGGETGGPAIVPGHPERSYLLTLVEGGDMPPSDDRLSRREISTLRRWIESVPKQNGEVQPLELVSDEDRRYWAFQPPRKRPLPPVRHKDRVRTPIDTFILEKLEANDLGLSPDATPAALLRRAHFDLLGLPPSPAELDAFLNDTRPDAYERKLDELLASPHYGERWGRHWLDVAGFVDVRLFDGDASIIYLNEGMWRYRDYVVAAFNADKPYDQFVTEQLAGDELSDWATAEAYTPQMKERLVATGFLRNAEDHTSGDQYGVKQRYEVMFDMMQTVSTSLLGLTFECARCHSHKFDPIPQRDYYRLLACFEPAYNVYNWLRPAERVLADVPPKTKAEIDATNARLDAQLAKLRKELEALEKVSEEEKKKTETQRAALKERIAEVEKTPRRGYATLQALWDHGPPPPSRLLRRGDALTPGPTIEAGFPEVLGGLERLRRPPDTRPGSSGRRLALAHWLTRDDHPLTGRVVVNRVWMHHFGAAIVGTPGNFGRSGAPPTHPELLDWLAVDFVENGWSLKRLHKQIMTSTVYRQASRRSTDHRGEQLDPENKLLWRMNLQRIESELVRDAILHASGQLSRRQGGPAVMLTTPPDGLSRVKKGDAPTSHLRRSLYLLARRIYPLKFLEVFDSPDHARQLYAAGDVRYGVTVIRPHQQSVRDRAGGRVRAARGRLGRYRHETPDRDDLSAGVGAIAECGGGDTLPRVSPRATNGLRARRKD